MKKRGLVISFDALLALTVFISLLILMNSYLADAQYDEANNLLLKESSLDIATVLEKNGEFEWAVENNKVNRIRSYINKLPNSICVEVQIYSQTDFSTPSLSVLRPGCKKNFDISATINRSFIHRNGSDADIYLGRVVTWFKVES